MKEETCQAKEFKTATEKSHRWWDEQSTYRTGCVNMQSPYCTRKLPGLFQSSLCMPVTWVKTRRKAGGKRRVCLTFKSPPPFSAVTKPRFSVFGPFRQVIADQKCFYSFHSRRHQSCRFFVTIKSQTVKGPKSEKGAQRPSQVRCLFTDSCAWN